MTTEKNNVPERIGWLLLIRVFVATFQLSVVAFVELHGVESPFSSSHKGLYYIFGAVCLTAIIAAGLDRRFAWGSRQVPALALADLVLATLLVHLTGGMASVYSISYALIVIYAALLGGRRVGYLTAGVGSALYGLLLFAEYGNIFYPMAYGDFSVTVRQILAKIIINTGSLFVIAGLTSLVVERERRLRRTLGEREDAFRNLDLLHRHIVESIDTGIFTIDRSGRVKSFNRAAKAITGWHEKDVLQRNVLDLFPKISMSWQETAEGRAVAAGRLEMRVCSRTGSEVVLGYSISPLLNHNGGRIGHIIIFQDITQIKQMEAQIQKSRKLALIGELSAGLAHEMRNPLAAIGGSIQVLRQGIAFSESDERLMQIILRGKEQLDVFLRDFLLLSRPARGPCEEINIVDMIGEILETVRYGQSWNDRIEVEWSLEKAEKFVIPGNRSEVRQALMNVILNAVQAMPDGGSLDIRQNVVRVDGASLLSVAVMDTGCGIDEENAGRIFEPFFTSKDTGTGLGLAIVSRVMESHGGKVQVDSQVGKGTTITLLFPLNETNRKE